MTSIVVFCGSSEGYQECHRETAYGLGNMLAERGYRVVYGGAKIGLMGAVADGALDKGGDVIGVIPHFLRTKEVTHEGLTELILTNTMHERKLKMHELSDGVITLPGGWGTMEEMFEMLTWGQLGLHQKPMGMLNINGYYDSLKVLADTMVSEGFLKQEIRDMLLFSDSIEELLDLMENYVAPDVPQWVTKRTT
ncbi:TIGR00730 family Rossman fold protein [Polluticoccus soli]|uniref:LOG family protein n=1 Tax=Polluticoccus soli TaxID=3034150 RepID=UPI0023E229C5|nr:TIGR00730 family Rossman fold protein [Flavipsychrobacter sp. JY13-12]